MSECTFLLLAAIAAMLIGISIAGAIEAIWFRLDERHVAGRAKVKRPVEVRKIIHTTAVRGVTVYPDGREAAE